MMKIIILILLVILLFVPASAIPDAQHTINGPVTLNELHQTINNDSILSFENNNYTIHESIGILSNNFVIDENLQFESFLIFQEDIAIENTMLTRLGNLNKYDLYIMSYSTSHETEVEYFEIKQTKCENVNIYLESTRGKNNNQFTDTIFNDSNIIT
ncbi:MAG: hypothetical protein KAS32_31465, partial [Candidatus Peribacteraceae bacterium]|nr:hypothetical protein [Candidatus Peribacteraceae bacterium]